jgi:hypothetical protein
MRDFFKKNSRFVCFCLLLKSLHLNYLNILKLI